MMTRRSFALGGAALLTLALAGCFGTSEPSRFYLLTPVAGPERPQATTDAAAGTVYLAAVELPQYLTEPSIVTRVAGNQLEYAGLDRWGEPLEDNVVRVLLCNLELLLPNHAIGVFPWERPGPPGQTGQPDHRVEIAVTRFDAEDGRVVLTARWAVVGREHPGVRRRSEYVVPISGAGYPAIVAAMSDALAALGRDVADAIRSE